MAGAVGGAEVGCLEGGFCGSFSRAVGAGVAEGEGRDGDLPHIKHMRMPVRPMRRNFRRPNRSTKKAQKMLPGKVLVTHREVRRRGMNPVLLLR